MNIVTSKTTGLNLFISLWIPNFHHVNNVCFNPSNDIILLFLFQFFLQAVERLW